MTDFNDPILRQFGLTSDPFSLSPDPEFFFESPKHGDAHAALELGVTRRRGLLVVTGEVGTGKTTVIRSLLEALPQEVRAAYVSSTTLAFPEILRRSMDRFGVKTDAHSKGGLLKALEDFLVEADRRDEICVLAIDEAQNLNEEAFEELRLLLNIESAKRKLLQIVLLGQPELDARLNHHEMRHIADRIAIRCPPLPLDASLLLERELDEFDPEARLLGVWLRREIRDRALTTWADETLLRVALAGMLRTSLGLLGQGREAGLLVRYGGHGDHGLRIEMAGRRPQVGEPRAAQRWAAETMATRGGGGPTVALALRVASRIAELHEGALELLGAEHGDFTLRLSLPAVDLDAQQQ